MDLIRKEAIHQGAEGRFDGERGNFASRSDGYGGRPEGVERQMSGQGGFGGRGGRPGGGPAELLKGKLAGMENGQILFVGSVNCLRHKPYLGIGQLMQEGKASILCPTMSDFSSGRYLTQIEEAVVELSEERNTKEFVIICGCQWVILSTDGDMIVENLARDHGIHAVISQDDHLEFGDHE